MTTSIDGIAIPILLVDDRPENLLSLEELLRDQGYELVKASSGNEALRQTLRHDFALVLLDVQMPEMDGFETAELMRANPKTRHIPIIFVTAGLKDLHFQFRGYDSGAVDYLTKPIEPVILQSKVRIFAELYRQRREIELHRSSLEELVERRTAELKASNAALVDRNRELEATENLLRGQVMEFVETHDQLLATEEMLRVQIEEYQEGQKLLNEANQNLQTLFDVSPLAIVVSSCHDGYIRRINHTFSDDFGYAAEFVSGKTGVELGLWVNNSERTQFLDLMLKQEGISGFATEIKTFHGETRNVLLYSTIVDFMNEQCMLIVFFDVTEQKRMEDRFRQTQKMEVIGQLAGGVAHDFNNMLTAILGSAELLERHVHENLAAMKLLGNIQQAASRSADLTGQLLAFSRKGSNNLVPVCIDSTIKEVLSLLERTLDKNITLTSQLQAKNANVTGDPALLQNALLNLGVNARDAMSSGGVISFATANVELDRDFCNTNTFTLEPGSYLEITVSDNGMGMSPEIVKRIFEPFFTTKEIGKGTGLGMAVVYSTVSEHHGGITIDSTPGIGTEFRIYLPLASAAPSKPAVREETFRGSGGVLLVDDEEILRDVGKSILETLGYHVYLAEDGLAALEVYERNRAHIALVILDMLMPNLGGRDTLIRLRKKYPDICVIISSGYHQEGTIDGLLQLGARSFLQKPYSLPGLCKVLAEVAIPSPT
jgi:PAS domain S-box-containing protein